MRLLGGSGVGARVGGADDGSADGQLEGAGVIEMQLLYSRHVSTHALPTWRAQRNARAKGSHRALGKSAAAEPTARPIARLTSVLWQFISKL